MLKSLKSGALGILVVCSASGAALADTVFSDGTFTPGNYTTGFTYNNEPGTNTVTALQCSACGNPGAGLEFTITEPTGGGAIGVVSIFTGVINSTFAYDPATQGAITAIDSSVDKNFTANSTDLFGNTFRTLIEQDGNFYAAPVALAQFQGPGTTGYLSFVATDLVASDFGLINASNGQTDFSSNPNFTSSGDDILFGIAQQLGSTLNDNTVATADYDNLSITVNPAPVPEPLTLSIFGAGVFGAAALRRRRRTSKA